MLIPMCSLKGPPLVTLSFMANGCWRLPKLRLFGEHSSRMIRFDNDTEGAEPASDATLIEQFMKFVSGNPRFRKAAPAGAAVAIVGARPLPPR
jgi:hypothetical protein